MAKHLAELCGLLIEESYGTLPARIFRTLALHRGLTLLALRQHTGLGARAIKQALIILSKQNILRFNDAGQHSPTSFEIDWPGAYQLARHSKIIALTEHRLGEGASSLVSNLIELGHASVHELAELYDFTPASKRDSGYQSIASEDFVNGDGEVDHAKIACAGITNLAQFHNTLRKLLKAGFVSKVGPRTYQPAADVQAEAEDLVKEERFPDGRVSGSKKEVEFKAAVKQLKRKWCHEAEYSELDHRASKGVIMRPGTAAPFASSKRLKVNGELTNGINHHDHDDNTCFEEIEEPVAKLPSDMVLQINIAKVNVALRTQHLTEMGIKALGRITGAVYGALLLALETKVRAVRDDLGEYDQSDDEELAQPIASVVQLSKILDSKIDVAAGINGLPKKEPITNGTSKKQAHNLDLDDDDYATLGIKKEHHSDDEGDEPALNGFISYADNDRRLHLIEQHLHLLAEHPKHLCEQVSSRGKSEWRVNFPAVTHTLIEEALDRIINNKFDTVAKRVCRLLRENGKLDETQVTQAAMMRNKDCRTMLTILQAAGFVDSQELPKDNGRQPSRTLYFWWFDTDRVRQLVLHGHYKAMARCLQRMKIEREKYVGVVAKAERIAEDGFGEEKLEKNERVLLRRWKEMEERLLTQVVRMDTTVGLLRDFTGLSPL